MFKLRYKIWLESEGKVFGKGPYELLKGIKEKGSLREASKQMNMSYNKAFNLIKDIEKKLGKELVVSKRGGVEGGFSTLTEEAEELIQTYEKFMEECEESLWDIYNKYFGD